MTYATAEEIFQAIKPLLPPRSDNTKVVEVWSELAAASVEEVLKRSYIALPATDMHNFLKLAQICFYIDIAKNGRQVEYVTGDVQSEMMGRYKKEYSRSMPMFFFAQGAADPFFQLLPTQTFNMRGYKYLTAYIAAYFESTRSQRGIAPAVRQDTYSRGRGWEENPVDSTEWYTKDYWGDR